MPFKAYTDMDLRLEFVQLATAEGANIRALCRQYQIAPNTAYRLLARYRAEGEAGLLPRSRRPHTCPHQTPPAVEAQVLTVRAAHPTWGGRKIAEVLKREGSTPVPTPSTITTILQRHQVPLGGRAGEPRAYTRFERAAPNELWQLDFMGHRPMLSGRVHPLTILDDHSRFGLGLFACANERARLVQQHLITVFQQYGLPEALLVDHGSAWGSPHPGAITWLVAWWMRLGIHVLHGRPAHPQTRGKIERWHATIATDLFQFARFPDLDATQVAFDRFRQEYNTDRPHEALAMQVPLSRYHASLRPLPEHLPEIVYSDDYTVHTVAGNGCIWFAGRYRFISEALRTLPVGVRPTATDGVFVVRFCDQEIKRLDLHRNS
jgi:transposase InsO family protein